MDRRKKIIIGSLAVLLVVTCLVSLLIFSWISMFNSYSAYSESTSVAEVNVSELKKDELGSYADVEVRFFKQPSALSFALGQPQNNLDRNLGDVQSFKVYGDTIYTAGPVFEIKEDSNLNFEKMYKVGKVYGRYELDIQKENSKSEELRKLSEYDLNGGYDDWKTVFNNIKDGNIAGQFYNNFIESSDISTSGIFVTDKSIKYSVNMTQNGFTWEVIE